MARSMGARLSVPIVQAVVVALLATLVSLASVPPVATGASAPGSDQVMARVGLRQDGLEREVLVVAVTRAGPWADPVGPAIRRAALTAARAAIARLAASGLGTLLIRLGTPLVIGNGEITSCDLAAWRARYASAQGAMPDAVLAFLVPPDTCPSRRWRALADPGSDTIALSALPGSVGSPALWLHELGHLLGLGHAAAARCSWAAGAGGSGPACSVRASGQIGDRGTTMGTCDGGFAAHELWRLGSPLVPFAPVVTLPHSTDALTLRLADPYDRTTGSDVPRLLRITGDGLADGLVVELDTPAAPYPARTSVSAAHLHVRLALGPPYAGMTAWLADLPVGGIWMPAGAPVSIAVRDGPGTTVRIVVARRAPA